MLTDKHVVVTGGTGSLGKVLIRRLLTNELGRPRKITVFSRDETKQHHMRLDYQRKPSATDEVIYKNSQQLLSFQIGDVRDFAAVAAVLRDADVVVNTAALKQVPTCEYFPVEAVRTNILGPNNLVRVIREHRLKIDTVVGISTDKACKPVNVMGMTKAIQERVFLSANLDCPDTRFICVRYGNVLASRGSVVPLFHEQIRRGGPVTITTEDMTRFLLSLDDAVDTIFAGIRTGPPWRTLYPPRSGRQGGRYRQSAHRQPRDHDQGHRHPARRKDSRSPHLRGGIASYCSPRRLLRHSVHPARIGQRTRKNGGLEDRIQFRRRHHVAPELKRLFAKNNLLEITPTEYDSKVAA